MVLSVVSSAKLVFRSDSSIKTFSPPKHVRHLDRRSRMPKKAQISDEHKRDIAAFFQARLAHVKDLGYDLGIGEGVPKYIRFGCAQKDVKLYPNATPIYEKIVRRYDKSPWSKVDKLL